MKRVIRKSWLLASLIGVALAGCDNSPQQVSSQQRSLPKAVGAKGLSLHYVEVTFADPVGTDMERKDLFKITAPDARELFVREAARGENPNQVILTTDPQSEVQYSLLVGEAAVVGPPVEGQTPVPSGEVITFGGITGAEPRLLSAISLSNTSVLLTYDRRMDRPSTQNKNFYNVSNPDLNLVGAVLAVDDLSLTLMTSPQTEIEYLVKVTNVKASLAIYGGPFIDPDFDTATFFGFPRTDTAAPKLISAEASTYTTIRLSFNEPLQNFAGDPSSYTLAPVTPPPASLLVFGAVPNEFGTQVLLQTQPLLVGVQYRVTVALVEDRAGNPINGTFNSATFTFNGGLTEEGEYSGEPRVVGAISINNTIVDVHFSEPMGDSAADPEHYRITGSETAFLIVMDAILSTDRTTARLTTVSQGQDLYTVQAAGVKDLDGNPIAAPSSSLLAIVGLDPTKAQFLGNAPREIDEHIDTDKDGFADWFELVGWPIIITNQNGDVNRAFVTSDPFNPDTDDDGLTDGMENAYELDPRTDDTDADRVSDGDEFDLWYSDPADQDTDNDGFDDWLEINFFLTSPILADTDGDGFSDSEEIMERNRNPFIADLPLPQITVDEISLDLNVTSSFTDEEGMTQSRSDMTSATFTQSRTNSLGTSDTTTTQSEAEFGQEIGVEGGTAGFKVSGKATFGQSQANGFSSTVDKQTSETSQQEYQESVTTGLEFSQRRSVTRNIESAIVQATVNIANKSDLAFSITNLEVSLLQQDRLTGLTFRPIASLRPTGAADPTSQPVFNLAPKEQERGPIIFENTSVFPNRIDALMREPTGLIFEVVNFDVLDENGRNLVFTSQDVEDRTVGITIDFGNGRVEAYRVATASQFDESARAIGISMERALEIIGVTQATGMMDDVPNTYETMQVSRMVGMSTIMVEALVRIRDVENSPDGKSFWTAVASNTNLDPNSDFSTIPLHAHETILIMYTSDEDEDNLFLREEYLFGSLDTDTDSDDDTLGDFFEVRTGWSVAKVPGLPYKTFPSPARPDSDLDGLEDDQEFAAKTDPNRADTDEDGLSDPTELLDTYAITLFDGDVDIANNKTINIAPYSDWAIITGPNGRCDTPTLAGDDTDAANPDDPSGAQICVASGPNGIIDTTPGFDDIVQASPKIDPGPDGVCNTTHTGASDDVVETMGFPPMPVDKGSIGKICISAGGNGILETPPVGDDFIRVTHRGLFGTDPVRFDTDLDGIGDGRERLLGINPNKKDAGSVTDTDGDGLFDQEEDDGWAVAGYAGLVSSNKNDPDTDRDGIPDLIERAIASHPNVLDTDGDTLLDFLEFNPGNSLVNAMPLYNTSVLAAALQRCTDAPQCTYLPPSPSQIIGTHPARADTDGDTRNDNIELTIGWNFDPYPPGSGETVLSDPLNADLDGDTLNDAAELTRLTDPDDSDSDDDGRLDGAEITATLNPLRKDKRISVTMVNVAVVDDCDDTSLEGLEIKGGFQLTKPDGVDFEFVNYGCTSEEGACGVRDCCMSEDAGEVACPGEAFAVNTNTGNFVFQEGEAITFKSDSLTDIDSTDCTTQFGNTIGTMSEALSFDLVLPATKAINVGSGSCLITGNYTITIAN